MPPQELIGLTPKEYETFVLLAQEYDSRLTRQGGAREVIPSGANVQLVKLSSITADVSLGYSVYPANWYEKNPASGALTIRDAVWVRFPNGVTPSTSPYYEGHSQGLDAATGKHIFWVGSGDIGSSASVALVNDTQGEEQSAYTTDVFEADGWVDLTTGVTFTPPATTDGSSNIVYRYTWSCMARTLLSVADDTCTVSVALSVDGTRKRACSVDVAKANDECLSWCGQMTLSNSGSHTIKLQGSAVGTGVFGFGGKPVNFLGAWLVWAETRR